MTNKRDCFHSILVILCLLSTYASSVKVATAEKEFMESSSAMDNTRQLASSSVWTNFLSKFDVFQESILKKKKRNQKNIISLSFHLSDLLHCPLHHHHCHHDHEKKGMSTTIVYYLYCFTFMNISYHILHFSRSLFLIIQKNQRTTLAIPIKTRIHTIHTQMSLRMMRHIPISNVHLILPQHVQNPSPKHQPLTMVPMILQIGGGLKQDITMLN